MFYREWLPSCSTRHFIRTTLHRCHAAAPASVHIEGNSTDFIAALNNTLNTVQKRPELLAPIPTDNTMSFKKTMQLFFSWWTVCILTFSFPSGVRLVFVFSVLFPLYLNKLVRHPCLLVSLCREG